MRKNRLPMVMKKRIAGILPMCVLVFLPLSVQAQKIEAKQPMVNCGQVLFRQPVVVEYELKNTGFRSLRIKSVRTSCGCTSVEYPSQPIASGDKFVVKVVYDAKQMGHFDKQVGIYSNASSNPLVLTMRGVVVGEKVDFDGEYAYELGELQVDVNNIEFDDVNRGDRPLQVIHIRNISDRVAQPQLMHLPNYLSAEFSPSKILPGRSGVATITLDTKKLRDFGLTQTSVYLGFGPGDKVSPNKEIPVSAVLLPNFNKQTDAQLAMAPQLKLSTNKLNLGEFNGKSKLKGEVLVENVGKSELNISSLQMFTTGIGVSLNKTKLAPGESAKMKITADAKLLKTAKSAPRVLMITNDPAHAKTVIDILVK